MLFTAIGSFIVIFLNSCSPNYFQQAAVSPAYSKTQLYSCIIGNPVFTTSRSVPVDDARNRCLGFLRTELSKKNFQVMPSDRFEEAVKARSFGGSGTLPESTALELAASFGAQTLVFAEISAEAIKGGLPMMASIRIIRTQDGLQLYSGKARAENPASMEAGLEFAIEKAIEGLK